ncbi:MAG: hypothetical protein ACRERD_21825 [Candidatus Binatia bacterium]
MKRMIVGIAAMILLWPGMGQAQSVPQSGQELTIEFAKSVASPVLSVIYFPLKLTVGTVGAILGGVGGLVTGGDERVAEGIWRPMTGGTYFITPEVLESQRPFLPFDGGPYASPATWPSDWPSYSESPDMRLY